MELIGLPTAIVSRLPGTVEEGPLSLHLVILELPIVVSSIRVREFPIPTFHTVHNCSLKLAAILVLLRHERGAAPRGYPLLFFLLLAFLFSGADGFCCFGVFLFGGDVFVPLGKRHVFEVGDVGAAGEVIDNRLTVFGRSDPPDGGFPKTGVGCSSIASGEHFVGTYH